MPPHHPATSRQAGTSAGPVTDYRPIRDTGRRTRGRGKQRPAPGRHTARCQVKGQRNWQLSGWVRSALTQPRPSIVTAARNPSREPALTEPGQQATRPPHPRQPAARGGRRNGAREARPRPEPGTAQSQASAAPATIPRGRQPPQAPAPGHPPRPRTVHRGQQGPRPPHPASPARAASPPESQARPGKTPGQPGQPQYAQAGHSQEPPPGEPDINAYTGTEHSPDSERAGFR
jgi:hypothetical protein